ncbi:dimethylaniline monooxygenase [Aspergillus pseudoustus]|uniref:Dimethylaniline monooxygenase n=1 Tax=Aspergillus pseudoustus TaxID=1810923 RepID=A0ABR4JVM7_9EURO
MTIRTNRIDGNDVFERYGIPAHMQIGSNTPGPHPSSHARPVNHPEWNRPSPTGYGVSNHLINEPPIGQRFKIIMMGAGAAGIDFLHHAPTALKGLNVEIVCYDKNPEVGGTWFENRYPGCACDVPSLGYTFPWKQNPSWSTFYASAKEIWEYMKGAVDEEDMMQYIQLNTAIVGAEWDDYKSKWQVSLERKSPEDGAVVAEWVDECDVLLNGTGFLNAWRWPEIPGIDTFEGDLFHTAHYDDGYSLKGKRVAVIGAGSSGIQVVASILDEVDELYTWVRSPTWITAAFGQAYAGKDGQNFSYSEEQKKAFADNPKMYHQYKKTIESELNTRFKLVLRNTKESDEANASAFSQMSTKLRSKPELLKAIIPQDFNVACRRPTPGNGYLEALVHPKTTVFTQAIERITPTGVVDSGKEYPVDVIICATGFDTSFRPRFSLKGLDKTSSLAEKWKHHPRSYLGIGVDGFPNYFTYSGPYTPVAQGSILSIISMLTCHFLEVIKTMRQQHIRRLSPKEQVVKDFVEHADAFMPRTCWADPCPSWFKQGKKDGPLIMWPGSRLSYFELLEHPYLQDYDIVYWNNNNRFGFMGTGFVDFEFSGNRDLTWYLDKYSQNEEWVSGVPLDGTADEFKAISQGAIPGERQQPHRNGV